MTQIELGRITIDVEYKDIKNIHLSVYPPQGAVKISAPQRMDLDTIRVYAISKLQWIKKQQRKFKEQKRETKREYLTKESHYFKGKRYLLKVFIRNAKPEVILKHNQIDLYVRSNSSHEKKEEIMDEWYRSELKTFVPKLIAKWETKIGVKSSQFRIRKMRTRWGSCNCDTKSILLNLELAKKPVGCLEYIIVHELVHLLERTHNSTFVKYMDKYMPKWRFYKDMLNSLPFRNLDWKY